MKKSELDNLIRTIVKEEIAHSIPVILTELAGALAGNKQVIQEDSRPRPVQTRPAPQQTRQPVKKIYTQNTVLNEILNSTEGGIPQEGSMGGMMAMMETDMGDQTDPSHMDMQSEEDTSYEAPSAVESAFTKNYSQFLKRVDKIANTNHRAG